MAFTESVIDGEKIETVNSYKNLGAVFDNQLKWDVNTEALVKRGMQRIHLLRTLNSFSVSPVILCLFLSDLHWKPSDLFFYLLV